jgi:hypothetical protein
MYFHAFIKVITSARAARGHCLQDVQLADIIVGEKLGCRVEEIDPALWM